MNAPFLRQLAVCLAVTLASASLPVKAQSETSPLLINQWIRQAEDGSVGGKLLFPQTGGAVSAVSPAAIGLLSDQHAIQMTQTDDEGSFRFDAVEPGVYTLLSRGADDACAVIALHVLSAVDPGAVGLPQQVELAAGQIKFSSINMMMIRYLPPTSPAPVSTTVSDIDFAAISPSVASGSLHRILQSDGGMVGQVFAPGVSGNRLSPSSQTNIFIFQDREEVLRTLSDTSGAFQIQSLPPGLYSALFIGASGMGLVGFELVSDGDEDFTSLSGPGALVQASNSAATTQLIMQVAPADGVADGLQDLGPGQVIADVPVSETVISEEIVDTGVGVPMGGGGGFAGGGGAGGGGAGGVGGGGGGRLLGIAGLVAGIVALATDDDSPVPPPATPSALLPISPGNGPNNSDND
jgi:hypothetical protein